MSVFILEEHFETTSDLVWVSEQPRDVDFNLSFAPLQRLTT